MRLASLEVFSFPMPFRAVFRHASARRDRTENLIVAASSNNGLTGYGEGCPRSYVSGETVAGGLAFVDRHRDSLVNDVHDVPSLKSWIGEHGAEIDRNPAAFCAIELAILDLLGQAAASPVEDLLGIPALSGEYRYSAVLGDAPYPVFRWQYHRYRRFGFHDFKIKLSGDLPKDRRKIRVFRAAPDVLQVRLDANNFWESPDVCVGHVNALQHPFLAIEEPLKAGDFEGFGQVARDCGSRVILDESLLRAGQLEALGDGDHWIVNVRVSKMGGIIRSLEVAEAAEKRGIGVIVGAQVGETSILTRAGLAVMSGIGGQLVAAEGAFGTRLLREDLAAPCLMFGPGGILRAGDAVTERSSGLGLRVRRDALAPAQL